MKDLEHIKQIEKRILPDQQIMKIFLVSLLFDFMDLLTRMEYVEANCPNPDREKLERIVSQLREVSSTLSDPRTFSSVYRMEYVISRYTPLIKKWIHG